MAEREQEYTPTEDEEESVDSDEPKIPEGALRGIKDVEDGNTANEDAIEAALKF